MEGHNAAARIEAILALLAVLNVHTLHHVANRQGNISYTLLLVQFVCNTTRLCLSLCKCKST